MSDRKGNLRMKLSTVPSAVELKLGTSHNERPLSRPKLEAHAPCVKPTPPLDHHSQGGASLRSGDHRGDARSVARETGSRASVCGNSSARTFATFLDPLSSVSGISREKL